MVSKKTATFARHRVSFGLDDRASGMDFKEEIVGSGFPRG